VYKIIYTDSYVKKAKKFAAKHPEVLPQYKKTLQLLEINPLHPSLRLHKLKGKHENYFSVSINITYRITLDFLIMEKKIFPINVGTHDEVY
jgi:mRNA-degrading endonuclease YafQ of YafQ-DinJ toxin-antitoxin module